MQSQKTVADQKREAGRWSKEEHERFMLGLMQYGKNWKKVQQIVSTRSGSQVRSHAQKFFNKIQKCTDPKHKKGKTSAQGHEENNDQQISFTQNNDMIHSLDQDNSLATPLQIISLIKKESVDNRKVNLSSFKKSLEQNQQLQNKFKPTDQNKESFLKLTNTNKTPQQNNQPPCLLNSFKSMNNILSAYQALNQTDPQNRFQDQSFLIGLTKKYKKYFAKGGHFENLIDFGNPHEVAKAAEIEKTMRKKSWTLAEGIEGDEHDLEDIKKKLKESKNESRAQPSQKLLTKTQQKQKNKQTNEQKVQRQNPQSSSCPNNSEPSNKTQEKVNE